MSMSPKPHLGGGEQLQLRSLSSIYPYSEYPDQRKISLDSGEYQPQRCGIRESTWVQSQKPINSY
jgi:hypothetical protein